MTFKQMKKTVFLLFITVLFQFACSDKSASEHARDYTEHKKDTAVGKKSIHYKRAKLDYPNLLAKPDTLLVFSNNGYVLLPKQSELEWFCGKHTGVVLITEGGFQVEKEQLVGAAFSVDMDSIYDMDIDNDLMRGTLENVLRSEDFFDAEKFPVALFKVDSIINLQGNLFQISGKLKIKDIEKQIQFNSLFNLMSDTLFVESEKFTIVRTDWGINHMSKKYMKNEDEFVFTDSLQFIVHITAVAESNDK